MKNFITKECDALREKLLLVPFAKILVALLLGIAIGNLMPSISRYTIPAIAIVLLVSTLLKKRFPYLLLILLGISLNYLDTKEEGVPRNRFVDMTVHVVEVVDKKCCIVDVANERLLLLTTTPLHRGDMAQATILVESLDGSSMRNKSRFLEIGIESYARLLPESEITVTGTASPNVKPLYETRKFFYAIRQELVKRADRLNLYKNDKAIVKAITLGERRGISTDTQAKYAACGVSHVLSISGLHIGILFLIFNTLFLFIPRRTVRSIIVMVLLWFYVFLSGASPSALRAAFMLTLLQGCYAYAKSRYQLYNILFASAVFFLLIDHTLLLDVGFQLSYLALFAILFLYYRISLVVNVKNKVLNYLLSILLITIAVQIITTPFVTYYFGVLSLTGVLANTVFTLLLPVLMWAAILYIAIPNALCEQVIKWTMACYDGTITTAANLPFSSVTNYYTSAVDIAAYIVLFILSALYLTYFFQLRKKQ